MGLKLLFLIGLIFFSGCATKNIDNPFTFITTGNYTTQKECSNACMEHSKNINGCLFYPTNFELIKNECKCEIAIICTEGF